MSVLSLPVFLTYSLLFCVLEALAHAEIILMCLIIMIYFLVVYRLCAGEPKSNKNKTFVERHNAIASEALAEQVS